MCELCFICGAQTGVRDFLGRCFVRDSCSGFHSSCVVSVPFVVRNNCFVGDRHSSVARG